MKLFIPRGIATFLGVALLLGLATGSAPNAARAEARPVEWRPQWRKVQPFEYVASAVFALSSIGIFYFAESRTDGSYGGVLFDDGVRDLLRSDSRTGRHNAGVFGDWGYRAMLAFPYVDVAITWAIHGNSEVAWQMLAIDFEALTFAGVVGLVTNHFWGRGRPSVQPCSSDPTYESYCNRGSYSSFISGHSVTAAAGAGVTCAHHLSMPLYGGGAGDIAACAATSAIALATGISRIVSDRHWATDVLAAWIVGAAAGYVWPRLFHYSERAEPAAVSYVIFPSFMPGAFNATLMGAF